MPRSKVDPRLRRRVAQACDTCKRRKEKCSGLSPCNQCQARGVEYDCRYSKNPQPPRDGGSKHRLRQGQVQPQITTSGNGPSNAIPTPLQHVHVPIADASPSSVDLQTLKDSKGKFIYAGESATLSFLEIVINAVQVAVGPCAFTNEPARNPMIENTPKIRFEQAKEPDIDLATTESLTEHFFAAVSGILDLFDAPWLIEQLRDWAERPSQISKSVSAIIHLALAIGLQGRAEGDSDDALAEQCFAYGRQLTMFHLLDEPSLGTIQAVLLITYYMIAVCQHNAAFINLGAATRAAYTIGIHLHETNVAFDGEEGLLRERAWKSLRVCDLFLAASLGRPPATSEAVSNIGWAMPESKITASAHIFSSMFRICNVFERILVQVYAKRAVSLELAKSISQEHRQWTEELPRMLKVDGLESDTEQDSARSPLSSERPPNPGCSVVTMAYYYSIILLTRPFLTFQVRHASTKAVPATGSSSTKPNLTAYSDACVNSAIKSIDIAHTYVFEQDTPRRRPLVVNSVFISTLCLGLASMDPSDRRKWSMEASLDRAIKILLHLGRLDSQSARYAGICVRLKEAVTTYATRRDNCLLRENDQVVRGIFGDVGGCPSRHLNSGALGNGIESPQPLAWSASTIESIGELMTPPPFDFNMIEEEYILPTSGAGHMESVSRRRYQHDPDAGSASDSGVDLLSGHFLDLDVPLFPLASYISPESCLSYNSIY
ncbi:hypothetical protein NM208_g2523 [Fusarium decemcellulare]|uniref:Uncharacterized protein n=1 Tax=Fusarium decemcellulare TaxID=57161 RepID=A0ACC1SSS7_9HYPO|nr:hypothetical protein NM208_g2523 [Fusarium decemcellulare]